MYLLYLDDSGTAANRKQEHLVLGGVCIEERQVQTLTGALDVIAARLSPADPLAVEFHASEVFHGRDEPFKSMRPDERRAVIKEVLAAFATSDPSVRAFASAVYKPLLSPPAEPMELAFVDLCYRFDDFLERVGGKGLIILDESTHATRLMQLSHEFRRRYDGTRHIVDGPLFVSSRAFRCTQLADHVAYAVFRRYEAKDGNYFDVFAHRFDVNGRVIHGLAHLAADQASCLCPACLSRR